MAKRVLSEAEFLKDVATHTMIVLHDDGNYRHVRFKRPGTSCMHFDLVTWPGYLAYSGDMGCFVFTRLRDMFEFFRDHRPTGPLNINLSYWSEKLQAVDGQRTGGNAKEFSEARFRQVINEYRTRWVREDRDRLNKEQRRELWDSVQSDVLDCFRDEGEEAARLAAHRFNWRPGYECSGPSWSFDDLWDHDFTEYTRRFVWCCFALAWGIRQYDASRVAEPTAEATS